MSRPAQARTLRVGERYRLGAAVYRVVLVNACRARLEICGGARAKREFQDSRTGELVEFEAWVGARHLDVSPQSILERVDEGN